MFRYPHVLSNISNPNEKVRETRIIADMIIHAEMNAGAALTLTLSQAPEPSLLTAPFNHALEQLSLYY